MKTSADLAAEETENELKKLKRKFREKIRNCLEDKEGFHKNFFDASKKDGRRLVQYLEREFADDLELWENLVQWSDTDKFGSIVGSMHNFANADLSLELKREIFGRFLRNYSVEEVGLYWHLANMHWGKITDPKMRDYLCEKLLRMERTNLASKIRIIIDSSQQISQMLISEIRIDALIEYCSRSERLFLHDSKRQFQLPEIVEYLANVTDRPYR